MTEIEEYLDELYRRSRSLPARDARALLAEAEAHLYDALADGEAHGLTVEDAAREALAAFGPVDDLIARERGRVRLGLLALATQVTRTGFVLGSIGALAVGASGVIAAIVYWVGGASAVAAQPRASDLTAANCARWTGLHPGPCRAAALSDWAAETIGYRIALGILGLVALLAYRALSRRRGWSGGLSPLVSETIATTLFVCAAVLTSAIGVQALVTSSGAGPWLTAAPVAIAAAAVFGARLTRRLREPLTS